MGTTLTGTTPQDTYDSLIKVTDNGPLSATAKYLSDGLGNDSVLALSTTAVGINTSSPAVNLHISGDASGRASLRLASTAANRLAAVSFYGNNVESAIIGYEGGSEIISGGVQGDLIIRNVLSGKDIILDTNAGNVGIGTTTPTGKLTISQANSGGVAAILLNQDESTIQGPSANTYVKMGGNMTFGAAGVIPIQINTTEVLRVTANGLTFNGDTAAANALDDYEEGTWTMGVTFNGASVGVTTSSNTGTYVKIGRQVTVNGYFLLTNKGSSTGIAYLTGLPFTVGNTAGNFGAASLWLDKIAFANQFQGRVNQNVTYIELEEITEAGVVSNLTNAEFANNSGIMISATYQV
jgi:hypothetical protein